MFQEVVRRECVSVVRDGKNEKKTKRMAGMKQSQEVTAGGSQ